MSVTKDIKGAWRDSKKFTKKHPFVAIPIALMAGYMFLNIYGTSYLITKSIERGVY